MDPADSIDRILENLFFSATEPLSLAQLAEILELCSPQGIEELRQAVSRLGKEYTSRGLQLVEVAGGFQLATQPAYVKWVKRLRQITPVPLSEEARFTLAVVAYQQPTTRLEIEALRRVDCESVLATLISYGLITIVGELGSGAYLYGTTKRFLQQFGLKSLADLPALDFSIRSYR